MEYFEDYNLSLTQKLDKKWRFAKVSFFCYLETNNASRTRNAYLKMLRFHELN